MSGPVSNRALWAEGFENSRDSWAERSEVEIETEGKLGMNELVNRIGLSLGQESVRRSPVARVMLVARL